jgi:hypothetical protein
MGWNGRLLRWVFLENGLNNMSSAVIRQITNGWVVVIYIPASGTTPPSESEAYYATIQQATAAIVLAL